MHPQIWPCLQLYAKYAPCTGSRPTEDFVPDQCLSLAVLAGLRSGLSSRPLLHYLWCSESSLSPFYWAGFSYRPFSMFSPSLWNWLSLALRLFRMVLSNSFYAHLWAVPFSRAGPGSTPE